MMNKEQDVVISIIVPVYNQSEFIELTVHSILAQKTDFTMEILIGDDASTDGTTQKIRNLVRAYPDVIRGFYRTVNLGATQNSYQLMLQAKGRYLGFLEGDDLWSSEYKIQKQVALLECKSKVSACIHDVALIDRHGNLLKTQKLEWIRPVYTLGQYDGMYLPSHISSLVCRNFFHNHPMDYSIITTHRQISDRILFMILFAYGSIEKIPETMSKYRVLRSREDINVTRVTYGNSIASSEIDIQLFRAMSQWLWTVFGIKKQFYRSQARIIIALVFGKNSSGISLVIRLKEGWRLMDGDRMTLFWLPVAFFDKVLARVYYKNQ